ncbi:MAG: hypothetical protein HYY13_03995 [Nitrospirae bacterium]|nr:hypothetical protein [Nitrospirota bacterium]
MIREAGSAKGRWVAVLFLLAPLACADGDGPTGLAPTRATGGPKVIYDIEGRPFPDMPFPNNAATRMDPTSPTGRRISASLMGPTALERDVRVKVDQLSGFSTIGAISVSFDAPLDVLDLARRHQTNHDLSDDAVYVVNLDRSSDDPVELDMGRGNFPLGLSRTRYFDNDPREGSCNVIFETVDEDVNGNGSLDPGEDTNDDGRLGKPNFKPGAAGNCLDDLLSFYDVSTHTLILRPVVPLREESTYAVILTDRVVGTDGRPVQSPFPYVNHAQQTQDLDRAVPILKRVGVGVDQIAFAWTFTTQSVTRDMVQIRRGLYGDGPLAFLSTFAPPELSDAPPIYCDKEWNAAHPGRACNTAAIESTSHRNPRILKADALMKVLLDVLSGLESGGGLGLGIRPEQVEALRATYDYVDFIAQGEFMTPYFICHRWDETTQSCKDDHLGVFDIDYESGTARNLGKNKAVFWLAVPKANGPHQPPFPVAFYGHGYTSSRVEFLGFAGHMAKHGIASIGMEAVGHGIGVDDQFSQIANVVAGGLGLLPLVDALPGRARDLNGDGVVDSGGDFFSADTFHTRDIVRQTIVDYMQLVRILRSYDGYQRWRFDMNGNGQADDLGGDWNGDGTPDVGGPDSRFYAWGQSLGGILSSVLGGIEPFVRAAAPVSGGGGLIDIGVRTTQGGAVEAVFLPLLGPMVIGQLADGGGETLLKFLIHNVNEDLKVTFARVQPLRAGDWVLVENRTNREDDLVRVHKDHLFRAHIAADAGDRIAVTLFDGQACPTALARDVRAGACAVRQVIDTFEVDAGFQSFGVDGKPRANHPVGSPLVSLTSGYGFRRNHPDVRRFMEISQMIVDPADPANYATHYFLDPLGQTPAPSGRKGSNLLVVGTIGDMNVPLNTAIMIARSAGILGYREPDPRYGKPVNDVLIDAYVLENLESAKRHNPYGLLFDPDNLSEGKDELCHKGVCPPRLDPPLRATVSTADFGAAGQSGMRLPLTCPNDDLEEENFQDKCGFGTDQHGFFVSSPQKAFDVDTFMVSQIARFFQTDGAVISDDRCLEGRAGNTCPYVLTPP